MTVATIMWDDDAQRIAADPTATLAVSRLRWESAGARFRETDDGDGEMPWLATAVVQTPDEAVPIGVLSYDDEIVYLLVQTKSRGQTATTRAVLEALADEQVLSIDRDVLEIVSANRDEVSLEVRVTALEDALVREIADLRRQLAAFETAAAPVALGPQKGGPAPVRAPRESGATQPKKRLTKISVKSGDRYGGIVVRDFKRLGIGPGSVGVVKSQKDNGRVAIIREYGGNEIVVVIEDGWGDEDLWHDRALEGGIVTISERGRVEIATRSKRKPHTERRKP